MIEWLFQVWNKFVNWLMTSFIYKFTLLSISTIFPRSVCREFIAEAAIAEEQRRLLPDFRQKELTGELTQRKYLSNIHRMHLLHNNTKNVSDDREDQHKPVDQWVLDNFDEETHHYPGNALRILAVNGLFQSHDLRFSRRKARRRVLLSPAIRKCKSQNTECVLVKRKLRGHSADSHQSECKAILQKKNAKPQKKGEK